MRSKQLLFLLLMAIFAPWAANAQMTATATCYPPSEGYATGNKTYKPYIEVNSPTDPYIMLNSTASTVLPGHTETLTATVGNVNGTFTTTYTEFMDVPFTQDFDDIVGISSNTHNNLPQDWDYIKESPSTSTNKNFPIVYEGNAYSGSNCLRFYILISDDPHPQYAILPPVENVSGLRMKFYAKPRRINSSQANTFKVGVMEGTNASTFVAIETITLTSLEYVEYIIPFDSYTGNGTRIAILVEVPSGSDGYSYNQAYIDDITVEKNPDYVKPSSLVVEAHSAEGEEMNGWYLIASPLAEAISTATVGMITDNLGDEATTENASYDLYYFDQTGETNGKEWKNYRQYPFNLESGKGYLYANSDNVTLTFTGTPYSGEDDKSITLVKTDGNPDARMRGWNLVGNPYTVNAYITRDFYVMNGNRNDIVPAERNYIEPMEGAFVLAQNDGEELTFHRTAPDAESGQGSLSINVAKAANHRGNSLIDRAVVRFGEGNVLPKFQLNPNHTKVYIPQDGKEYAIVSVGRDGARTVSTIPVNFKANENGQYTLTVNPENMEMSYLHLIDNKTGTDIDLLMTPSYTFEATTTDYESRFKLVFATGSNGNDEDNFAFFSDGNLIINGDGTLQVIDVMGRVVVCADVARNVSTSGLPAGVYVLRLINGDNVKVQ